MQAGIDRLWRDIDGFGDVSREENRIVGLTEHRDNFIV